MKRILIIDNHQIFLWWYDKSSLESISRVIPVLVSPAAGVPVVRHEALPVPASVCVV